MVLCVTRTAWAVFKYFGTKTVPLRLKIYFKRNKQNKGVGIRYKIRACKRAQVILSNIYYPSYIIQVILYKLNIQVIYKLYYSSYIKHCWSYITGVVL